MEYEEIKDNIDNKIIELAELIESFCVIDNTRYVKTYKNDLRKLHSMLEDLTN